MYVFSWGGAIRSVYCSGDSSAYRLRLRGRRVPQFSLYSTGGRLWVRGQLAGPRISVGLRPQRDIGHVQQSK